MIHAVINATNNLSLTNFHETNLMKIAYEKLLNIKYIDNISVLSKFDASEYLYNYHHDGTDTIIIDEEVVSFTQILQVFKSINSDYILYLSALYPFISENTINRICRNMKNADSAVTILETYVPKADHEFKYPSCLWNSPLYIVNRDFSLETGEMYALNPYLNFLDKIESIKIESNKELYLFAMYYKIKNEIDKRFVR